MWKQFEPEKFRAFREAFKAFSARMEEVMYEIGFLRK
jgi:hypothetical protein